MTALAPRAVVVHAIAGRARLRVDERVRDEAYFDTLARELASHARVREVHVNAATGSVLVLHDGAIAEVLEAAAGKGLLTLVPLAPAAAMRRLRESVETLDEKIARSTGSNLSLGRLAFATFMGAGFWQMRKGPVLPAAMTVFNYAWKALEWSADREPPSLSRHSSKPDS